MPTKLEKQIKDNHIALYQKYIDQAMAKLNFLDKLHETAVKYNLKNSIQKIHDAMKRWRLTNPTRPTLFSPITEGYGSKRWKVIQNLFCAQVMDVRDAMLKRLYRYTPFSWLAYWKNPKLLDKASYKALKVLKAMERQSSLDGYKNQVCITPEQNDKIRIRAFIVDQNTGGREEVFIFPKSAGLFAFLRGLDIEQLWLGKTAQEYLTNSWDLWLTTVSTFSEQQTANSRYNAEVMMKAVNAIFFPNP